jgi:predicted nucleic acid-binding protein
MNIALDSSVLISALCADDPDHVASRKVVLVSRATIFVHAYSETFSTLTGGRLGFRVPAPDAAQLLRQKVAPKLVSVPLNEGKLLRPFDQAESRGVRGGAIHDYLHLVAAARLGPSVFLRSTRVTSLPSTVPATRRSSHLRGNPSGSCLADLRMTFPRLLFSWRRHEFVRSDKFMSPHFRWGWGDEVEGPQIMSKPKSRSWDITAMGHPANFVG